VSWAECDTGLDGWDRRKFHFLGPYVNPKRVFAQWPKRPMRLSRVPDVWSLALPAGGAGVPGVRFRL